MKSRSVEAEKLSFLNRLTRRNFFKGLGLASLSGMVGCGERPSKMSTFEANVINPRISVPTVQSIGATPVVNCYGTYTYLSGSLMPPEVKMAMMKATEQFVEMDDLMNNVGRRLAELTGARPPEGIDGVSFAPTLLGQPERQKQHRWLYWEFAGYGGQQALRTGHWKGIRRGILRRNKPGLPPLQLYDLASDPGEKHNVADQHPDVVTRVEEIMRQEHEPSRSFPVKPLDGP